MNNQKVHILIVDDDLNLLSTLGDILMTKGYKPVLAQTGTSALAQAEQHPLAVALIDLQLGDMSGLEVIRGLKTRSPKTECILLTGHASQDSAIEAIQAGAYGYFQKPFDMEQVLLSIQRAVEKHAMEDALRESEDRYRDLIDNSQDLICTHDLEGRILSANPWAAKVLGYEMDTILRMNIRDFLVPETRRGIDAYLAKIRKRGAAKGLLLVQTATGEQRIWEYNNTLRTTGVATPVVRGMARDITERKRAEDALKKSEAHYRLLADHMVDTVWLMDMNMVTTYISPSVQRLRGYTLEELQQLPLEQNLTPASFQVAMEFFAAEMPKLLADSTDSPASALELEFTRKDGSTFWSENKFSLIRDERGKPVSILGEGRDISERKRAEEALRESERRHRAIYDGASMGIAFGDLAGHFVDINLALQHILGYSLDELKCKTLADITHPDDLAADFALFQETIAGRRQRYQIEKRFYHKDGHIVWGNAHITVVRDENGNPEYAIGMVEDITERKQAKEKVEQERILLRTLIDNIPDRVYVKDVQGRKTISNITDWRASGGKTMEEVVGKTDFDIYPPELAEAFWAIDRRVIDSGISSLNHEEPGLDSQGNPVWVLSSKVPLRDAQGKVIGLVGVGRDISERKRTEKHIENLNRLYLVLSSINETIVRSHDTDVLYQEACRIAVEHGKFRMAWIGLVDQETQKVKPIVQAGFVEDYLDKLDVTVRDEPRGCGPTGTALREEHYVICNDIEHEPWMEPWREDALRLGYRSSAAFPLRVSGHVRGIFNLYASEPDFFSEEEIKLLEELAQDISFAMEVAELDKQRQLAEQTLRESEARFATIFHASPVRVAITRFEDGLFQDVNQGFLDSTGYVRAEVVGHTSPELNNWVDPAERLRLRRLLEEQGPVRGFEAKLRQKSGQVRDVLMSADLIELSGQRCILSVGVDITERKRAEELLGESELKLRRAQHFAHIGSWTWNIKTNRLDWSDEMYNIFGLDKQTFSGLLSDVMARTIHPDDRAKVEQTNLAVINEGKPTPLEYRVVWSDGTVRVVWAEAGEMMLDEVGAPSALSGTVQDITERKRAEETLRALSTRQEAILTAVPDILMEVDQDKVYTWANPAGVEFFGEQVVGREAAFYFEGEQDTYDQVKSLFSGSENVVYIESWQRRKDGERRLLAWRCHVLKDTDGNVVGALSSAHDITERKQAEEALRDAEAKYHTLVEEITAIIYVDAVDDFSTTLYMSPQVEALLGYSPEEFIADVQTWLKCIHPDDLQAWNAENRRTNATGEPFQLEYRLIARDGHIVWVYDKAILIYDAAGQPKSWQGVLVDITERKRAEEALIESEERYRHLMENLPDGVIVHSQGRIVFANPASAKIGGAASPAELIGKPILDFVHPDYRESALKRIQQSMSAGVPNPLVEEKFIGIEGTTIDVEVSSIPFSYAGKPAMLTVFNDISKRKQTEDKLRESEKEFHSLAESMPQIVWITRPDGWNIYFNQQWVVYTGQTLEESYGHGWNKPFHPDDQQRAWDAWQNAVKNGTTYSLECRLRRADGVYTWWLIRGIPILDAHRNVLKWFGTCTDINEFKQAEQALAESEIRYRGLFENSPIAIWEEDFSAVKQRLEALKHAGVTDFRAYLAGHQEVVAECVALVKVLDVNKSALAMQQAENKTDLLTSLTKVLPDEAFALFQDELVQIAEGRTNFNWEGLNRTLKGEWKNLSLNWAVTPGHEDDLSRVIVSMVDITERKQAEVALRRSEALYRQAIEVAGAVPYLQSYSYISSGTDANIDYEFIGEGIRQITGYGAEEFNSLLWDSLVQESVLLGNLANYSWKEAIRRVRTGADPLWKCEYLIRARDGKIRWVFESAVELYAENGVAKGSIGMFQDITERKQAEQALRESEIRFRSMFETMSEGVAIHELLYAENGQPVDYRILTVNPAYSLQTGLSAKDALGAKATHLYGLDTPPYLELYAKVASTGAAQQFETYFAPLHKYFSISVFSTGQKAFSTIFQDITARKQAEADLQKRASQLELINDVGREIAAVLNLQNVLEIAARRIHEDFGFYHVALFIVDREQNELVMKARAGKFAHIFPAEHRIELGKGVVGWTGKSGKKILANNVHTEPKYINPFPELLPTQSELSLPLKVGKRVMGVLDVQSPNLNAFRQNDVVVLETLADQAAVAIENARLYDNVQAELTERKKAEAELRQHRAHLEELIEVRTAALLIAKENAETANRAKSDFLATMSHEIRTPLNGVLGLTHLAMQTNLTTQQRGYLTNIQHSGETLLSTINDILDFSKIEAGKIYLEHVDFSLDSIFQSISSLVVHKAREKGLELVFNTAPDVPRLLVGDPMRLGQVFTNLVGNAIKFTEAGEVEVKTTLLNKTARQVVLEFSVRDTGIGLTEAQLAQLFQPFSQADTSTSRKYGGTGLGLTISQRLVNMMGGEITVQSQFGLGSTFKFTLRLDTQAGIKSRSFATGPELSGLRVLVVDDHPATREFLQSVLESFSFHVTVVSSAEAGLAHMMKQKSGRRCDLALMDFDLPGGMDGLEAIRRIKQHPKLSTTPAILLVNADEMLNQTAGVEPDGYLVKPITRSRLFDAIMMVFGDQSKGRTWPEKKEVASGSLDKLRGRQVLLVEDNEINQIVATEMLQSLGLQVSIASTGEEAIQKVKTSRFDVILMDIQMPSMDGYQATAQIRTDVRFTYANLPVIALTAHALAGDREKALDAGLNDYITKPIDLAQLTNVLLNWVGGPQPADSQVNLPERPHEEQPPVPAPALPGIDMDNALERLEGNQVLFQRLLRMFRANYLDAASEIRAAFANNDLVLARRLVHTLKGVSGNISARALSAAARELESHLETEHPANREQYLVALEQQLEIVLASLASLQEAQKPSVAAAPETKTVENIAGLAPQLGELAHLLATNDTEAAACVANLLQQIQTPGLREEFLTLEKLIQRYDFEAALKNLRQLAQRQGIQVREK